jgi:S-adenosylmethionine hydrolase
VALRTVSEDRLLVGPDNGLLLPAAERFGGVAEAVEISTSPWRLEPVAATFHGRDVFAPVAARLASGGALADAGEPIAVEELVVVEMSRARAEDGVLIARVMETDTFGNLALDAGHEEIAETGIVLGQPIVVRLESRRASGVYTRTFADVRRGSLLLYEDAGGSLALAVNGGDAAALLGLRLGDEVRVAAA